MQSTIHAYEVRRRKDKRGVDLISDVLPFGGLWYTKVDHAVGYAQFYSRSEHAIIRVYDESGAVPETYEDAAISANRSLEFLAHASQARFWSVPARFTA